MKTANTNHLIYAAENLIKKLEEVESHPSYRGIFILAHSHGMEYSGPQYKAELDALRLAVKDAKEEQ